MKFTAACLFALISGAAARRGSSGDDSSVKPAHFIYKCTSYVHCGTTHMLDFITAKCKGYKGSAKVVNGNPLTETINGVVYRNGYDAICACVDAGTGVNHWTIPTTNDENTNINNPPGTVQMSFDSKYDCSSNSGLPVGPP